MRFRGNLEALKGPFGAVITPFTEEGEVDLDSLRKLARFQRDGGLTGLSIGGSTGEPSSQTLDERIAAMEVVAEVTADQIPFIPATGSSRLDETLELTRKAIELGADAVLLITPYYARPTQRALVEWYKVVSREFPDVPVIIYNVPTRTAVDVNPETVLEIRRSCENVVGIKETTRDFEHFSRVIALCGRDFLVWSGIELLCLPLLALGGVGYISALANITPRSLADMYLAWQRGDVVEAQRIHYALHPLADLLFVETNPAPAKWVLHRAGKLSSAKVRPPLIELTEGGQDRAGALLAKASDIIAYEGLEMAPLHTRS
ncbi:4-hydroxy-tetrahydrodipicolinate synthase [Rubrobacter calidifluminis]|uniref:4-hydroxy-tetrahydrodipicolinate synthase n=1 Tax=Rubrobacter calidifluminis TaxID=1392640 RepID=UPI00235DF605|nr:4-hydroxy-tetrahydrodipicolinate synthase [Rubrobacter calidifluminis]